jgi:molybdopterin-guanine dinucleotide biosynthesis protein
MAIIVVGGHSRDVGKTSVVTGLIAAFPERQWTAVKITQHGHDLCAPDNQAGVSYAITEELDRSGSSDTSRFLAAGAWRALWVRTLPGCLAEAMPQLRRELEGTAAAILESNSVLQFLQPDLYLTVLDPATPDFKPSAREFLDRADAFILRCPPAGVPAGAPLWEGGRLNLAAHKPVFRMCPPDYVTEELIEFVRGRLGDRVIE